MKTRLTITERGIWGAIALVGGLIPGWLDLRGNDVQGPVLILMLVNFALTLPGRAPVWLVAIGTWLGLPLTLLIALHELNPATVIALVPAFIAAGGGKLAGLLLDTAASRLAAPVTDSDRPWYDRPLSTRFILAVALTAIAAMGFAPLTSLIGGVPYFATMMTGNGGRRVLAVGIAPWIALVWMIITLLGWIGFTPFILSERRSRGARFGDAATGVRPTELIAHVGLVITLAVIHAAAIVALCTMLRIPTIGSWQIMALIAFKIFLPLDFLAYLTILALGFASDVERQRRNAVQREAALKSEMLDSRLSALRARLNPHFLFNALNSVNVLARSGKTEETSRVVDGLTGLLRYVLDERRPTVPLRDELEFARQYLAVQQVRFGSRLAYDVSSDERAGETHVPQLLLQPIVENALEHGIGKTLEGGRVSVTAVTDGGVLRVTVQDDGPGHAAEADDTSGIGLANTRERLARLYGDRASLTLSSAGAGTRVEILLPLES